MIICDPVWICITLMILPFLEQIGSAIYRLFFRQPTANTFVATITQRCRRRFLPSCSRRWWSRKGGPLPITREKTIYWNEAFNTTSNKMLDFETVSRGSRHRSNHTQNKVPSIVAVHQSLQSGCKGPDSGMFPITVWHIQASAWTNSLFSQLVLTRLPL